jgi:hypothetical protein
VASALWNNIFSRFGISWVMLRSVLDLLAYWWKSGSSRSNMEDGAYMHFLVYLERKKP